MVDGRWNHFIILDMVDGMGYVRWNGKIFKGTAVKMVKFTMLLYHSLPETVTLIVSLFIFFYENESKQKKQREITAF